MTGIEFYESLPEGTVVDPSMFTVGQQVPFRIRPSGRRIGTATVLAVDVDDDGRGLTVEVQLADNSVALNLMREKHPGFSFSMRDPDELAIRAVEAFRDPLAGRPPTVRRRR